MSAWLSSLCNHKGRSFLLSASFWCCWWSWVPWLETCHLHDYPCLYVMSLVFLSVCPLSVPNSLFPLLLGHQLFQSYWVKNHWWHIKLATSLKTVFLNMITVTSTQGCSFNVTLRIHSYSDHDSLLVPFLHVYKACFSEHTVFLSWCLIMCPELYPCSLGPPTAQLSTPSDSWCQRLTLAPLNHQKLKMPYVENTLNTDCLLNTTI